MFTCVSMMLWMIFHPTLNSSQSGDPKIVYCRIVAQIFFFVGCRQARVVAVGESCEDDVQVHTRNRFEVGLMSTMGVIMRISWG